jgi:hypothetical protein
MKPLHPVTIASRNQALDLAKAVAAAHPGHYGPVPPAWLALRIRELLRFCEDSGIWQPTDLGVIIAAMFAPAPEWLPPLDRDHAIRTIMQTGTTPEARARTVALALGGTLPPGTTPRATPRG